jgi:hypothetical protein
MDTNIFDNGLMSSALFNHDFSSSEFSFLQPIQKHRARVADADSAQCWMGADK